MHAWVLRAPVTPNKLRSVLCSIKEPGLYDYVIFNDDLEDAYAQLVLVAKRALSGKQGNGSRSITGPVTLVAEEDSSQPMEPSSAPAPAPAQVSAVLTVCEGIRHLSRQINVYAWQAFLSTRSAALHTTLIELSQGLLSWPANAAVP